MPKGRRPLPPAERARRRLAATRKAAAKWYRRNRDHQAARRSAVREIAKRLSPKPQGFDRIWGEAQIHNRDLQGPASTATTGSPARKTDARRSASAPNTNNKSLASSSASTPTCQPPSYSSSSRSSARPTRYSRPTAAARIASPKSIASLRAPNAKIPPSSRRPLPRDRTRQLPPGARMTATTPKTPAQPKPQPQPRHKPPRVKRPHQTNPALPPGHQ